MRRPPAFVQFAAFVPIRDFSVLIFERKEMLYAGGQFAHSAFLFLLHRFHYQWLGNASAIAGVDPGYTLTISNTSNMTANNGIANLNGGNLTITSGRNHVTVAARFADGAEWIILDTYV